MKYIKQQELLLQQLIKVEKGNFKIVSSVYEFEIDANKEIFIPCFTGKYPTQIQYSIANLDKNYMKLFSQINNLENTVLYSKNIVILLD